MSPKAVQRKRKDSEHRRGKTPRPTPLSNSPMRHAGDFASLALVAAHASLLVLISQHTGFPGQLAAGFGLLSLATFAVYARDKRAARLANQRTPEATLHLLEVLGGWPGALLAQRALRHKNRKLSYQFAFWGCVIAHEALLCALWKYSANS